MDGAGAGRALHIKKIPRLFAVTNEVFHRLAVRGTNTATTEYANGLRLRIAMPTFHKLEDA